MSSSSNNNNGRSRTTLGSVIILTSVAIVTATTAAVVSYRHHQRRRRQRQQQDQQQQQQRRLGNSYDSGIIKDSSTQQKFDNAVEKMRSKSFVQQLELSNPDKLMIYGLYKQVMVGDAPETMPSVLDDGKWNIVEEHAKYSAWDKVRGMTTDLAALHYIAAVEHFESLTSDWVRSDDTDDDDSDAEHDKYIDTGGMAGPGVVSRPIDMFDDDDDENNANNTYGRKDSFDDAVDNTGTVSFASSLLRAASQNSVDEIRKLLLPKSSSSPSHDTAANNDAMPTTPIDVNTITDPNGQTALHIAADKGCLPVVQVLVQEYNTDVNVTDIDGISVLQTAVIAGQYDVCEWLLTHTNADPDQPDNDGDTPRLCSLDDPALKTLFDSVSLASI